MPSIAGASDATGAPVEAKVGEPPRESTDPPAAPISPSPRLSLSGKKGNTSDPPGYADQKVWRVIQSHLPTEYQLTDAILPSEEWWDWSGHKIHLDRYPNPSAPVKVILFHGVSTNG